MKTSLAILFGLCTVVVAFATGEETEPDAASDPMHTVAAYKSGQEVLIRLSYDGSIKNWDAAFTHDAEGITIGNNGTLTITDSEGTAVTPKKGKLVHKFANVRLNKKFDALINLAAVYDLSKPGHYVVEWGCKNVQTKTVKIEIVEVTAEVGEHTGWPAGTVMAADKSNATHRMTLTFSIDGHIEDQKHEYLFRVLDKPSNLVISFPASGSHGDGGAGGFSLYVVPNPLSVFKDDRISFKISFSEKLDGKKASVEETVTVLLMKEDSGKVGAIKYKTEWKPVESHPRKEHSGFLIDINAVRHKLPKASAKFLIDLVSERPDEDTSDHVKLDPVYRVILDGVEYALEPDSLILMHKGGTKIWKTPGVRNRVLRASKAK